MNYSKILRLIILGGICVLPFISFIIAAGNFFPNMFFPFITGKNFTFRIVVEIMLLCYVILALREPKYRPKASLLLWTTFIFVAWMGVATIFSVDPVKSFWSNFERMEGYISLLHMFALFVIAGAVVTADRWWERFFQLSVGVSTIQGVIGILQVLHFFGFAPSSQSGPRADTTFGNATYLAVYMLFNLFLTLFLAIRYFSDKNTIKKNLTLITLYVIAFILQFTTLYFTETRGAILGLVGGLLIAAIYIALRAGKEWQPLRTGSFALIGIVVVLVGGFFLMRNTSFVQQSGTLSRLASISLNDPTTQSRLLYIWPAALKGSLERPITGWGQENFNFIFNKYYNPAMYNQEQWFDRAHNEFLDWLVAGGIPAFVLYIALYVLAAWAIVRSELLSVPEQALMWGLLAANAFNSMFVFDNLISSLYFFMILAFLHGLSQKQLPSWMFLSKPMSDRGIAIAAPLVAVVVVGSMWFFNWNGIARATTLIDALTTNRLVQGAGGATTQTQRNPTENIASYKRALTQGELGKQEVIEQLFQFTSNNIAPASGISPEVRQDAFDLTYNSAKSLMDERKGDSRLELFMGTFLNQFGKYDEALTYLQSALKDSPQKQQIIMQVALGYLQKGDTQNALAEFKKALDEAPSYKDARVLYAVALNYAGQKAQADAVLTEGFGTVLVDDDRLLNMYASTKQYDRVIGIWKSRVEGSPKDAQVRLGLASAYFVSGDKTNTIAQLQKVAEIDASLAAQMQQLIQQIKDGTLKPPQ